jgi:integrase
VATKRKRGSSWEFIVRRRGILPKPLYLTFASEEEGDRYVRKLEALLDAGVVPEEFRQRRSELVTIEDAAREYLAVQQVPTSDKRCLAVVISRIGATRLSTINYDWAELWVTGLKRERNLSPSTIRHQVGALARCFDWGARRAISGLVVNPLRQLPKRYAIYNDSDASAVRVLKGHARTDVERDRRLHSGEELRIREILAGERPPGRERAFELRHQGALECLFELGLESGMRLREMYTLSKEQVDLSKRTVFLEKTKNGDKRQVPLTSVAIKAIQRYEKQVAQGKRGMDHFKFHQGLLFPWWNGKLDDTVLRRTTSLLSRQFARVFQAASCVDLRFHDLRHEATSRLFERTKLSDIEISRITGHKDPRVLRRYSNLRGSDLAAKLW